MSENVIRVTVWNEYRHEKRNPAVTELHPKGIHGTIAGWFEHGNIFRAGCTFRREAGKIFYFQPGHETCPSFHNPIVQRIIENGVRWVAPAEFGFAIPDGCPYIGKGAV